MPCEPFNPITEFEKFAVVISCRASLPKKLDERLSIYGTTDPRECLQIDMDNDCALFLLDQTVDVTIDDVSPVDP